MISRGPTSELATSVVQACGRPRFAATDYIATGDLCSCAPGVLAQPFKVLRVKLLKEVVKGYLLQGYTAADACGHGQRHSTYDITDSYSAC